MAKMLNANQTLVIETLGNFSVRVGDQVISDGSPRASQVWRLFKYILTNRSTPISTEKLIDLLWPDGDVDNPIKALYTLIYRLRAILNEHFDTKQEFIIFQHNSYIWNKNASAWFDAEEFERLFKAASEPDVNNMQKIELLNKAFDLYHGDYLSESYSEGWVFPTTNYYKRIYTSIIIKLSELCSAESDYSSIVHYCEKAIEFDPFDENMHATLINALISLGLVSQALAHYDYIAAMLYKELGVQPSDSLQQLYRNIHKQATHYLPDDLATIKNMLREGADRANEAFFCEIDTFKHIYRLELRALQRSGHSMFLSLITLVNADNSMPSEDILTTAYALLKRVALFGLRRGDVVTQPSKSQLMIMLPATTMENCDKIMSRLKNKFYTNYKGEPVRFRFVSEQMTTDFDNVFRR